MLTDPVLIQSSTKEEAIDSLLDIATSPLTGFTDTRVRALQSLVTLRHRASVDFWRRQYHSGNDNYAPVILEGLSLTDVNAPFAWLKEVEWTDSVEDAIINLLPSLLEDFGTAKVSSVIERVLPDLPARGSKSIKAFCIQEGITLDIADGTQPAPSLQTGDSARGLEDLEKMLALIVEDLSPGSRALLELKLGQKYSTPGVVTRIAPDEAIPLSYAQERLWFLNQLDPDSIDHNQTEALLLTGALNVAALERSINGVIARHESLRTKFVAVDGRPSQVTSTRLILHLPIVDMPEAEWEKKISVIVAEEFNRPFDLAKGPLVRTKLVRMAEDKHVLLLTVHQIVCDERSLGVFIRELAMLYGAFSAGRSSPLSQLPIQYVNYAKWQREWLRGEMLERQLPYWRNQLHGELPVIELPADFQRPAVAGGKSAKTSLLLPGYMTDELKNISRREGVTLFMTLLATFNVMLYRYTGIKDITVGVPTANRNRSEIEESIGLFANSLVMRTDLSDDPSFESLLSRVREVSLGAYAHQDLPFEVLLQELQASRSLSQNPLFQVMLVVQNTPEYYVDFSGLNVAHLETVRAASKRVDLTLVIAETEQGLLVTAEYRADLFEATTVERMLKHYHTLLQSVLNDPNSNISDLPMLTQEERLQIIKDWNRTEVANSAHQSCIHKLFEAQVELAPGAVAVAFENEQLKYIELNRRANRLARHLQRLGVGPEVRVGLCAERSIEMIVGLLAVLKAGGAYIPMDPSFPRMRLEFQLEDGQMPIVLIQSHIRERLPQQVQAIELDSLDDQIAEYSDENLPLEVSPENLAYVIYTSGSTGIPKGVMVSHRAVCNHLLWMQSAFPLSKEDRTLYKYPITYDVSVVEIFGALLSGAQLIVTRPAWAPGQRLHRKADFRKKHNRY